MRAMHAHDTQCGLIEPLYMDQPIVDSSNGLTKTITKALNIRPGPPSVTFFVMLSIQFTSKRPSSLFAEKALL